MASTEQPASRDIGDKSLHDLQPPFNIPPLHNAIPSELVKRFDPEFVKYYNKYNAGRVYWDEVPIETFRNNPAKYSIAYGRAPGPDIYRITEQKCTVKGGQIAVRIFEPAPIMVNGRPKERGVYINFHGGGWVTGNLSSDHGYCKQLVSGLDGDLVVFDVDYRLAPEWPYPTAIEDCWAAFNWVRREKVNEFNLDPERVAVGGPSAGGHLAAVIAHLCRDNHIPLRLQVLCVPMVDMHSVFTSEGEFDRENCPYDSFREMEFSAGMTTKRVQYFYKQFLGHLGTRRLENDWWISPIRAPSFKSLAPALVFTAEMDPLRDEGEAYADKLREAGCEVHFTRVGGAPHSFVVLDGILESGKMYNAKVIEALRRYLA